MDLKICSKAIRLSKGLRAEVVQKLLFSVNCFHENIERMKVVLVSAKRKRNGQRVECIVITRMANQVEVVIREHDIGIMRAVTKAAIRTAYRLSQSRGRGASACSAALETVRS